jgi:hypothetical protein
MVRPLLSWQGNQWWFTTPPNTSLEPTRLSRVLVRVLSLLRRLGSGRAIVRLRTFHAGYDTSGQVYVVEATPTGELVTITGRVRGQVFLPLTVGH